MQSKIETSAIPESQYRNLDCQQLEDNFIFWKL
jgi:hypothetical protein